MKKIILLTIIIFLFFCNKIYASSKKEIEIFAEGKVYKSLDEYKISRQKDNQKETNSNLNGKNIKQENIEDTIPDEQSAENLINSDDSELPEMEKMLNQHKKIHKSAKNIKINPDKIKTCLFDISVNKIVCP